MWCNLLGACYFFMVSILSVRKVRLSAEHNRLSLLDPRLTYYANHIFNGLVPVAFVASGISGLTHHHIAWADHVVLISVFVEIIFNISYVGAADVVLCVSFSLLYICFVAGTSALSELSDWPYEQLKMKTMWSLLGYNAFIFVHVACFALQYVLVNYLFKSPIPEVKVVPKSEEEFSVISREHVDDENDVQPFQDIESNVKPEPDPPSGSVSFSVPNPSPETNPEHEPSISDPIFPTPGVERNRASTPESLSEPGMRTESELCAQVPKPIPPNPEPGPFPATPLVNKANSDTAEHAALVGQMIEERTAKKRALLEAEELRLEVHALKQRNEGDHVKLEKVVAKLSERDLQLKNLESWLAAKNDEELSKIKMQMADKLNDISRIHRPKSARGGTVLENTSALQDLDAKEPVQAKNLQALSALRKMKDKKYEKIVDDSDREEHTHGPHFNMYQTM